MFKQSVPLNTNCIFKQRKQHTLGRCALTQQEKSHHRHPCCFILFLFEELRHNTSFPRRCGAQREEQSWA